MSTDLFGEAPELPPQPKHKAPVRRGYAGIPGTGPAGKTCKDCDHYYIKQLSKTYRKCYLMKAYWTGGQGSDIKASSPACAKFEETGDG